MGGKEEIEIETKRLIESEDGADLGVEWTISYMAAGRRWSDLPRATFLGFGEDGRVQYQRDYT